MRTLLLLGLACTLAACGHDDSTGPSPKPASFPGTYDLTMVDGRSLPFNLVDLGAYQANLVSGTLALHSDGTYSLDLGIRIDDSGNVRTQVEDDAGLWNVNGDALTLASTQDAPTRTGVVSGETITLQSGVRLFFLAKTD